MASTNPSGLWEKIFARAAMDLFFGSGSLTMHWGDFLSDDYPMSESEKVYFELVDEIKKLEADGHFRIMNIYLAKSFTDGEQGYNGSFPRSHKEGIVLMCGFGDPWADYEWSVSKMRKKHWTPARQKFFTTHISPTVCDYFLERSS